MGGRQDDGPSDQPRVLRRIGGVAAPPFSSVASCARRPAMRSPVCDGRWCRSRPAWWPRSVCSTQPQLRRNGRSLHGFSPPSSAATPRPYTNRRAIRVPTQNGFSKDHQQHERQQAQRERVPQEPHGLGREVFRQPPTRGRPLEHEPAPVYRSPLTCHAAIFSLA